MANAMMREPLNPPTAPQPEQQGFFGKTGAGVQQLLGNPAVQAMLLQGGISLLSGRGWGGSLGDAAGAGGKYQAGQEALKRQGKEDEWKERELAMDEAKTAAYIQNLNRSGGGGGGGGSGGSGSGGSVDVPAVKDIQRMLLATAKAAYDSNPDPTAAPPDELSVYEEAVSIHKAMKNGMPLGLYNELRNSGENGAAMADQFARTFAYDPTGGKKLLEDFQKARTPAAAPAAPEAPPPARPGDITQPLAIPQTPPTVMQPLVNPWVFQ